VRRGLTLASTFAIALMASVAGGQPPAPATGYLGGREPDTVAVIPPAPAPGSPRDAADREIFKATRSLEGTPRWALAQNDVVLTIPAILKDFSCAAGVSLDEQNASKLVAILRHMTPDLVAAYSAPKDLYKRPRPYMRDAGPICTPRSDALDRSFDYPSGHATFAWAYGMILSEVIPDRAGPILQRARAFGESRAVCGVHSASAVSEARTAAAALVAALDGSQAFRTDLETARAQISEAKSKAPPPSAPACQAEAALTSRTPW
jgi:acid phosphatase (class A)